MCFVDVFDTGEMGKLKDIGRFKTAALVGSSQSAAVRLYKNWSMEGTW